ncbi:MFS transporter [Bacillus changyiensis]|uniref:MFS transporter n=1 Tax=Bacillus changyiensis TaxID=3004103 RepID=UPI0022DFEB5C|nr:MFS transporter [Bacillus changyiensis]MDA1477217.1 MFS transporter [Bacillus changyiensis]
MSRIHFFILVLIVSISGFSQGMLLPVISIIFEQEGHSATLNGIHATGLYIGVLVASPFMEAPLRKLGFKPLIMFGGMIVVASLFSFVLFKSYLVWFFLRLIIGIGDHMLHFSTQTWVTTLSSKKNRGRNISLYGLSFSLGFAAGPALTPLINMMPSLPFIISGAFSLFVWLFVLFLKNDFPENSGSENRSDNSLKRFYQAFLLGWVAFLPTFGYGVLETVLNGNFPVYALRSGITVEGVSIILPAFAIGTIVFQYPLGILSDKCGRGKVLLIILAIGAGCFFIAGFTESILVIATCFFVAGMAVGSTFSLGISFMADLLPKHLLPAGNLMCGITFSFGSIFGPTLGGWYMQTFENGNLLFFITFVMILIWSGVFIGKRKGQKNVTNQIESSV